MHTTLQDLHYAIRMMLKRPGVTLITVLTLAVGVGMSMSLFCVVNAVIVRPLPYLNPETIFTLWQNDTREAVAKDRVSPGNFIDWRDRASSFERLAAVRPWQIEFQKEAGSQLIKTSLVSKGYFEIMGVKPLFGRTFTDDEFERTSRPGIVISHGLWQRLFGGDPAIIGRSVRTSDGDVTVIGVMPSGFTHPEKNREAWGALVITPGFARQRASTYLTVVGRPKAGVGLEQARQDMDRIAIQLNQEYPRENDGVRTTVIPLPDHVIDDSVRRPLVILMFSVGLLFSVACLNTANVVLVRGSQRMQEFAVRAALGAGRARLLRQLVLEAVAVSAVGSGLGVLGAYWAIRSVPALSPVDFPRIDEVSLDLNVILFAMGITLTATAILSAAPAIQMLSSRRGPALHIGFGAAAASIGQRLRHGIVVVQVALALVLLVGAGLLTRSFINLLNADPGFSRKNILATELHIWDKYPRPDQQIHFFNDLIARVSALPGVQAAGAATALPFIGEGSIEMETVYRVEGTFQDRSAFLTMATPDYFRVMGIPLIEGRVFTNQDGPSAAPVAVITEGIARRHWSNENPVGKRIRARDNDRNPRGDQMVEMEIVGVVGDVQHTSLTTDRRDEIFVPHQQRPFGSMMLVARTSGDPSLLAESIRTEVFALNPLQSFGTMAPIQELIGRTLVTPRLYLILVGAFAAAALVLVLVGIYGVISLSTIQRTREIGLRISLGAMTGDILRLVLRQGLTLVSAGIFVGIAASLALARFMESLLFHVTRTDSLTLAGVPVVFFAVAALACYLPARRATKLNAVTALRFE